MVYFDDYNQDILKSVPVDGGQIPTRLNPGPPTGEKVLGFEVSPNGKSVVFGVGPSNCYGCLSSYDPEVVIYSVKIDGSQSVVRLWNQSAARKFLITPDSRRVVFSELQRKCTSFNPLIGENVSCGDSDKELYSVPLDGGQPPAKLSQGGGSIEYGYIVTPDSKWVVYDVLGRELYSAPIDGAKSPVKLADLLYTPNEIITSSHTGTQIVYSLAGGVFSVPVDGSDDPIQLAPITTRTVAKLSVSPDDSRAVYLADQDNYEVYEVYSSPLDGALAKKKLSGSLVAGATVKDYSVGPNSSRVVYTADQDTFGVVEVFSVPLDGGKPPVKLNGPLSDEIIDTFKISPDGRYVVYRQKQVDDNDAELYSVSIDGSQGAVKISDDGFGSGYLPQYEISRDSVGVVYLKVVDAFGGSDYVFSVPIDGGEDPAVIIGPRSLALSFLIPTLDSSRVIFSESYPSPVVLRAGFIRPSVWADFDWSGVELGTMNSPFSTFDAAHALADSGDVIVVNAGSSDETPRITKAVKVIAFRGDAVIGSSAD